MEAQKLNIPELPAQGLILLPILFGQVHRSQSPEGIMRQLEHLATRIVHVINPSIDVVFLYTDGLFPRDQDLGVGSRKCLQNTLCSHRNALQKRIENRPGWKPPSFHYLSWNQSVLMAEGYQRRLSLLYKLAQRQGEFQTHLISDAHRMGLPLNNMEALLEILAIQSLSRELKIQWPKGIVDTLAWSLVSSPFGALQSELWLIQNEVFLGGKANSFAALTYCDKEQSILAPRELG